MKDNIKEWTCTCIKNLINENYQFYEKHEYQVDIYPLYYKVYTNGGWNIYEFFNEDEFYEHFKLIEF